MFERFKNCWFDCVEMVLRGPGDLVSRFISTLNGVTLIITLLATYLLSPLGL